MASPTPETLNEFDMVLSVTEASLNAEFLALYKARLPDSGDDDEETAEDPKYLISHRFVLKEEDSDVGIDAHIACPRVDMNLGDETNMKRTVRVVISFLENAEGTEANPDNGTPAYNEKYDSFFEYWDSGKKDANLIRQCINGWKLSFEAGLGTADIQQIEERHIRYFRPETYEKLKKGIEDDLLMPSSIFCLFEAGQIAKSFQLYDNQNTLITRTHKKLDEKGKPIRFDKMIAGFLGHINDHFCQMGPNPNPYNPFVLGYAISQPTPKPLPSEPYFKPQNFQFSVTHAPNGFGTLNFLMLLDKPKPIQNVEHNLHAGLFFDQFLSRIGASTPNPDTKEPEYHGVMAIAAKTFKEQYISKYLMSIFQLPEPSLPGRTITKEADEFTYPSANSCTHTFKWKSSEQSNNWYWGTYTTTITASSNYAGKPMANDTKRSLIIEVNGSFDINYKQTLPWILWTSEYSYGITAPFKIRFLVTTNTQGSWVATPDKESTSLPLMEDDPDHPGSKRIVICKKKGEPGVYGRFEHKSLTTWDAVAGIVLFYTCLGPLTRQAASNMVSSYERQIEGSLETLAAQIVLPAGNVFFFNGLSMDTDHHVYSLVKYMTVAKGKQYEKPKE